MVVHSVLTLGVICYLLRDPRTFKLKRDKYVEVGSEACLLVASLFLSLLNEGSYSAQA